MQLDKTELSLMDYLGQPAGPELGKEVYAASKKAGIQVTERQVKTRRYEGKILVYPKYFLHAFFILNPLKNEEVVKSLEEYYIN